MAHDIRRLIVRVGLVLAGAGLVPLMPAPAAKACGGFFCNQPGSPFDPLPVAQTAENVLFAMDRDASGQFKLEAHVQIFYTGPADKFSWVVPVDSAPTLDVGSNAVFNALLGTTQPRFGVNWQEVGTCKPIPNYPPAVSAPSAPGSSASGGSSGSADAGAGVSVSFRGDVGPYDAAVIKSDDPNDPKPLLDWLALNKYFVSPEGERLISEYVKENKHFVAVRLLSSAGVNEIQPLVMRFLGPGPCVPLKLTAIASINDLKVNLWVLAADRVVPDNFFEIVLNEARINWFNGGSNYDELVKAAANEAGGNAFTTEYAGPTAMLKGTLFQPGMYDGSLAQVRMAQNPPEALNGLFNFPRDSSLLAVLRKHIPVPDELVKMGVNEQQFYNQLGFYWQQNPGAFKPFSAEAFAADLEMKIVDPLRKAQALMDGHAKLTRLSTFISPEEMKVDPTFVMNPSLPDVPTQRVATAYRVCGNQEYTVCNAPVRLELRDGQAIWFRPRPQPVCYGQPFDYQREQLDQMPALAVGYARTSQGEGLKRFDKSDEIRLALGKHNTLVSAQPAGPPGGDPDAGGGPGGSGAGGTGGSRGSTAAGGRGFIDPNPNQQSSGKGCSCNLAGRADGAGPGALAGLFLLGGLLRARRRRSGGRRW